MADEPREPARIYSIIPAQLAGEVALADSSISARYSPVVGTSYNPDSLASRRGLGIYTRMLNDEQVKAAFLARTYAALSPGYEVTVTDEGQQEIADFIKFVFDEMAGSFDSKLQELCTARAYGFALAEKILSLIDYGPFQGKVGLNDLKIRAPFDINFFSDSFGNLLDDGISQLGKRLPIAKFCIHTHRKTFGNFFGESDLRAAYRSFWAKENIIKFMLIALERHGSPHAVFTHQGTISQQQRSDLLAFLRNMQARSGIIIPDGIMLDFKQPTPRTSEAFLPVLNYLDTQIRLALLMPGLTGMSAEQETGSLARAEKEFDLFLWIVNEDRRELETLINEQIIKPLIDLNFEVEYGFYPTFKFKKVDRAEREKLFTLWLQAINAGALERLPEDENKARSLIDFPPLPDGYQYPNNEAEELLTQNFFDKAALGITPPVDESRVVSNYLKKKMRKPKGE